MVSKKFSLIAPSFVHYLSNLLRAATGQTCLPRCTKGWECLCNRSL